MRIDSKAEAERALRHHHGHHRKHYDKPQVGHADHGDKSILGVGMDGVEVTPEELMAADQQLADAQQQLATHLTTAQKLHGPLGDGHGPVAHTMASAFLDRASQESGVQSALTNYILELQNVRDAIKQTLATYEMVDTGVAQQLSNQSEGQA